MLQRERRSQARIRPGLGLRGVQGIQHQQLLSEFGLRQQLAHGHHLAVLWAESDGGVEALTRLAHGSLAGRTPTHLQDDFSTQRFQLDDASRLG